MFPADLRHNFSRPSQYVNVVWATPKQMKTLERLGCSSSHWSHSVSKWALLYVRSLVILPKEEYHLKVTLNIWPLAAYSFIRYSPPPPSPPQANSVATDREGARGWAWKATWQWVVFHLNNNWKTLRIPTQRFNFYRLPWPQLCFGRAKVPFLWYLYERRYPADLNFRILLILTWHGFFCAFQSNFWNLLE